MRKVKKEQISSILKLIEEAHIVIKKYIEKHNIQPVLELLEDCQNAVISIGSQIEKTEGSDCSTIRILEKYCELIYRLSEILIHIVSEQTSTKEKDINISENLDETLQALKKLLEEISDSIHNGVTVQKEAVFLPYKASMWDSLESVWKAANEDPDCDAYVIPIPYFDRTEDGGFGEQHYEGDLYPKYVRVTDYKEFDLGEHKPDMIFIHNPYDEYNRVTSVHPNFYSKRLKEYTNMLVYIPYFIMNEKKAIEKSEMFSFLPGVMNAHRVIVQSENVKSAYINAILKRIENNAQNKQMLQDKILGIGSPKLDSVQLHKKETYVIPEEWKSVIKNKKVILYNTHLSLLMPSYSERFLLKLREVFELFRKREDVILLWRPHPLMISTARAMNPIVLEDYMKLVNDFCNEKWGIYDDSQDLERAIAISDAYYGSESSVAILYQSTGKPVLIHSINVTEEIL